MFLAILESIKYVGHLLPMVVLRVYVGYSFLTLALIKFRGDFLLQPKLAATIGENLPSSGAPEWYRALVESVVVPYWRVFAYTEMYCEFLIGLSLIVGFLVRPVALLGVVLMWNALYLGHPSAMEYYQLQLVAFLTLAWLGAGRCLGLDYFFFKRQRGWLW